MDASTIDANGTAPDDDAVGEACDVITRAMQVADAAFMLLRAELRLARSSALALIGFALLLVVLCVGAWLAVGAAIAIGIYDLSGSALLGIGSVALANLVGAGIVAIAIRGCWRDLSLPRTRRALGTLAQVRQ